MTVFWGGREGYHTLLNTDVKRELDHMGKFFQMVVGNCFTLYRYIVLFDIPILKFPFGYRKMFLELLGSK